MSTEKKNYINKSYKDWDCIVVQLNNGDTGIATIKMMRQDLEAMSESHSANRGEVMEMLVQALEDEYKSKESKDSENALS